MSVTLLDSIKGFSTPLPNLDPARWQAVYNRDDVLILRNKRALPRVWLVGDAEAVDGEEALSCTNYITRLPGSGPTPALIAYAPILKCPGGDAGACECSAQVRDMAQIILGPPAPAVNDYSHGMGPRPPARHSGSPGPPQSPHHRPLHYFLLTFTLPQELRPLTFAHQKKVYGLLMRAAAAALQKLALDPQYLGGRLGALAVLHTWTRALLYHPHVHLLVTGGALSADGKAWLATRHSAFLMPEGALAMIFRAKFCAALKKAGLLNQAPRQVWQKDWVVHCKAAGQGRQVLNYLARYVFRVAISNSRLERFENGQVTFRYRDNRSQQLRRLTLPAQKFIHRFLLHVLPRGCAKVRYYGLWSPTCRAQLEQARTLLGAATATTAADSAPATPPPEPALPSSPRCPLCGIGQLLLVDVLPPQRKVPP